MLAYSAQLAPTRRRKGPPTLVCVWAVSSSCPRPWPQVKAAGEFAYVIWCTTSDLPAEMAFAKKMLTRVDLD